MKINMNAQQIAESTGCYDGDEFTSPKDVKNYFTVANFKSMFGSCEEDQDVLDAWAETIIVEQYHCEWIAEACEKAKALLDNDQTKAVDVTALFSQASHDDGNGPLSEYVRGLLGLEDVTRDHAEYPQDSGYHLGLYRDGNGLLWSMELTLSGGCSLVWQAQMR